MSGYAREYDSPTSATSSVANSSLHVVAHLYVRCKRLMGHVCKRVHRTDSWHECIISDAH